MLKSGADCRKSLFVGCPVSQAMAPRNRVDLMHQVCVVHTASHRENHRVLEIAVIGMALWGFIRRRCRDGCTTSGWIRTSDDDGECDQKQCGQGNGT